MYYYLNIFFLFSIIGHIIENFVYANVDSGILFGFWTPIYGFGVVLILIINNILKKLKVSKYIFPFVLFIFSAIFLSTLEYIGGTIIENLFGRVFWNYSNEEFHIGKYTSLKMCLLWGGASILVVYFLKPLLDKFIKKVPKFITFILVLLFIIDIIATFITSGNNITLTHYLK